MSNYINAARPLEEASIFAVVLGLGCLCNCKLGSAGLTEAGSGAAAAILVDAKENAESFCVVKSVKDESYVSLLLCVEQALTRRTTALVRARVCGLVVKLCNVLYSRRTRCPITTKVSLQ